MEPSWTTITASLALVVGAFVAAIAWAGPQLPRPKSAARRKSGADSPAAQPDDTPETPATDDLGMFRRVLALEARLDSAERKHTDLSESVDRRFGRLNADKARQRAAAQDDPEEPGADDLPSLFAPAASSRPERLNGAQRRALIPRR